MKQTSHSYPDKLDKPNVLLIHEKLWKSREKARIWSMDVICHRGKIVLRNQNWEEYDMRKLLPENVIFKWTEEGKFQFNRWPRLLWDWPAEILYPLKNTSSASFLLNILHEIGHSYDSNLSWIDRDREDSERISTIKWWATVIMPRLIKEITAMILNQKIQAHYSCSEAKDILSRERQAWWYALRKLRELKKAWWDLSGGLSDDKILEEIRLCLLTHEFETNNRLPWWNQDYIQFTKRNRWQNNLCTVDSDD